MSKSWGPIGVLFAGLLMAACSRGDVAEPTSSTATTEPAFSTTSLGRSTTTTIAGPGLDLSDVSWVTHGPDGIRLDDGTLIWETQPFPASIARNRRGGFAFADSTGLWWFQAGAIEPQLVREGDEDLVYVAATPSGPVALIWGARSSFHRLADGEVAERPEERPVEFSNDPPWGKWTASNGISAWVTDPEVETDSHGRPDFYRVLEPAHLVITQGDEVLVDLRIADSAAAWARIHDLDRG
jgi:hypothetical protein